MIKVNKNDNIFDVISKIKSQFKEQKKIVLNFPFGHNILYNKVALKSLKNSFPNNKIVIVTTDILSKKIAKQVWIKYTLIKDSKFIEDKDILKYNYSFFEYFNYEIKKITNKILDILFKKKRNIDPRKKFLKYYKQKTNIKILLVILLISILIFSYVFLFVLNKTYVYITPDIQVKSKAQNFIFKQNIDENNLNKNHIKLKEFTKNIFLEEKISTTWIIQKERYRAKWKVTLINKYQTEIKLKNKTRLLSKNWILYETKKWITIPKSQKNKNWTLIPWTKQVEIVASLRDNSWWITWSRWNTQIENILLTLPWLNNEDKNNIYAKIDWLIIGWEDRFEKVVWEKDLINAKKIFIENLKKESIKQIQKEIDNQNNNNNNKYQILKIDNIYKFSDINIDLPELKAFEKIDYFKIKWEINVKTYAFNIDSVISKLKRSIDDNILQNKEKLLLIDNKSINIFPKIWVIYRRENPLEIKATVEVEYNIEYNFEEKNNNYTQKIKQIISWLDKNEAEKRLINESKISNAIIEIRPFFVTKVSKYLNNIEFIIEK